MGNSIYIKYCIMFKYYVYVYLNPLKLGKYCFGKTIVKYEPFYVGKGHGSRLNVHNKVIDKHNKLKQHVINKIKLKNKNPIIIKLYENISEYSAFRLEKYFINKIGRRDLGLGTLTNLTDGGEGGSGTIYNYERRYNMISNYNKIVKYDSNGIVLEIFKNIVELSLKYPNFRTNHIHRACKSNGNRKYDNYYWKYYNGEEMGNILSIPDNKKKIVQYDLTGNYVKTWNSSKDISTNLNYSSGAVLKCCRNNAKENLYYKFKNYMWFFVTDKLLLKIKPYSEKNALGSDKIEQKLIQQYTANNIPLGTFTPKELKNIGFFTKTIYGCCNGKFTTSQGYKWKWA